MTNVHVYEGAFKSTGVPLQLIIPYKNQNPSKCTKTEYLPLIQVLHFK